MVQRSPHICSVSCGRNHCKYHYKYHYKSLINRHKRKLKKSLHGVIFASKIHLMLLLGNLKRKSPQIWGDFCGDFTEAEIATYTSISASIERGKGGSVDHVDHRAVHWSLAPGQTTNFNWNDFDNGAPRNGAHSILHASAASSQVV